MKNKNDRNFLKRGEIVTAITIATFVVLTVTSLISSVFFSRNKNTTSTKAAEVDACPNPADNSHWYCAGECASQAVRDLFNGTYGADHGYEHWKSEKASSCKISSSACESTKSCSQPSPTPACPSGKLNAVGACDPACCSQDSECSTNNPQPQKCTTPNGYCQSGTSCTVVPTTGVPQYIRECRNKSCAWRGCSDAEITAGKCVTDTSQDKSWFCHSNTECGASPTVTPYQSPTPTPKAGSPTATPTTEPTKAFSICCQLDGHQNGCGWSSVLTCDPGYSKISVTSCNNNPKCPINPTKTPTPNPNSTNTPTPTRTPTPDPKNTSTPTPTLTPSPTPDTAKAGDRLRYWINCLADKPAEIFVYSDNFGWPQLILSSSFAGSTPAQEQAPDIQPKYVNPHGNKGIDTGTYHIKASFSDGKVEEHDLQYKYPNQCSPTKSNTNNEQHEDEISLTNDVYLPGAVIELIYSVKDAEIDWEQVANTLAPKAVGLVVETIQKYNDGQTDSAKKIVAIDQNQMQNEIKELIKQFLVDSKAVEAAKNSKLFMINIPLKTEGGADVKFGLTFHFAD